MAAPKISRSIPYLPQPGSVWHAAAYQHRERLASITPARVEGRQSSSLQATKRVLNFFMFAERSIVNFSFPSLLALEPFLGDRLRLRVSTSPFAVTPSPLPGCARRQTRQARSRVVRFWVSLRLLPQFPREACSGGPYSPAAPSTRQLATNAGACHRGRRTANRQKNEAGRGSYFVDRGRECRSKAPVLSPTRLSVLPYLPSAGKLTGLLRGLRFARENVAARRPSS